MSTADKLMAIVNDEGKVKELLALMASPMVKYRSSDKGKSAQQRARARYAAKKEAAAETEGQQAVQVHLQRWKEQQMANLASESDEEIDANLHLVQPLSTLWHDYLDQGTGPKLTRKQYIELLPTTVRRCNSYTDKSGVKHYNIDAVEL